MITSEGVVPIDRYQDVACRTSAGLDTVPVDGLREPDAGAAEMLVATYWNRVYRLALRIIGNESDAEEVAQDSLWAALRQIGTFRGDSGFWTWMYRITANTAYQELRRRRRRRLEVSLDAVLPSFDERGHHVEPVVDWSGRANDPALQTELRTVLETAIDDLPDGCRAVLVLHDVDGMSNVDIGASLDLSVPAVKSRLHRARLFLRRRLGEYMDAARVSWIGGEREDTCGASGARVARFGNPGRPNAAALRETRIVARS